MAGKSRPEQPKTVYLGLPSHLADRVLWVARNHRTNPLSWIPGGFDVVVEYHDGRVLGYDWIKRPGSYIETFFAGMVEYAPDAFMVLDERNKLDIAKSKIARFYARKHSTDSFAEIWNSASSHAVPWQALRSYFGDEARRYVREDDEDDWYAPPEDAFPDYETYLQWCESTD